MWSEVAVAVDSGDDQIDNMNMTMTKADDKYDDDAS